MSEDQIQKLAEDKYPFIKPDFITSCESANAFNKDQERRREGYKAAMLQNKGEWISDAIEFAEWINKEGYQEYDGYNRWIAVPDNNNVYTTQELYQNFKTVTQ